MLPRSRTILRIFSICLPLYLFIMLFSASVLMDNPHLAFPDQLVKGSLTNPFDEYMDDEVKNYTQYFDTFEGFVMIMSASEVKSHELRLYALPGFNSKIYREFSIVIFSNEPCVYEIKIDDQVHSRGYNEFRSVVKASSSYSTIDVDVRLVNETNVTLPVFSFKNIKLLDSPWDARSDDDDEEKVIAEEWIQFSRGEFNQFIATRIAIDVLFVFLAVVAGTSTAAISADTMGIQRVI